MMSMQSLPDQVRIREVGPRDGLQAERPVSASKRADLVVSLARAGCSRIEAASFVSEKAVPAMAGGREVIKRAKEAFAAGEAPTARLTGLVPNLRGALAALEAAPDELSVTVAASPTYNEKNVRRSIDDSAGEIAQICRAAATAEIPVDAVISCAFGSPYEGEQITPDFVAELSSRVVGQGCVTVTLADTTGMATPQVLESTAGAVSAALPGIDLGLHLHETRGTALLNAYVALGLGISRFDTAVGGLGGSPFAKGAGGNLSTEDFVSFLSSLHIATGIDLAALLPVAESLVDLVGHDIKSKVRSEA